MSFRYKKKFPLEPTRKLINDKIQLEYTKGNILNIGNKTTNVEKKEGVKNFGHKLESDIFNTNKKSPDIIIRRSGKTMNTYLFHIIGACIMLRLTPFFSSGSTVIITLLVNATEAIEEAIYTVPFTTFVGSSIPLSIKLTILSVRAS